MRKLFTSESVTEGHPDKLCDQVSDAVLDALLAQDPMSRVACETCATTGMVMVMGEITTTAKVDIPAIVRDVVLDIGYNDSSLCFDGNTCAVLTSIHAQSPDIAMGVDDALETRTQDANEIGAGDQGMMFGYACNETKTLMPLPHYLASRLAERLSKVRKDGIMPNLRPDGKTQVSVRYVNGVPTQVEKVVISTQHSEETDPTELRKALKRNVIDPVFEAEGVTVADDLELYVNPTGRFVVGGPMGDAGLTGRKIIVDTYGGYARHGGGAFSGKDPSKVDRSAAYATRWVAKNIVAAGLAKQCEVQVAYAIGVAKPVSIMVDTFGTGTVADEKIEQAVEKVFDLTPAAIIRDLDLRKPIYRQLAAYGHMGREDLGVKWENTDRVDALKAAVAAL